MPSVSQIIKMRLKRRYKYQKPPNYKTGLGCSVFGTLLVAVLLIGLTLSYKEVTLALPSIEILPLLLEPPDGLMLHPTRFYDRSGEHIIYTLQNPAITERRYLPISENQNESSSHYLPPNLVSATTAISDPTFWNNPGFFIQEIQQNSHKTIAQKLVSDLLLWDEPPGETLALRERILAAQITHHYGREKIIEWYLNSANYGNLAYGADAASQIYFGKQPSQLNLAEAAVLAAIAESPAFNPFASPETAIERGHIVIDAMLGQGLISEKEATTAKNTKITFQDEITPDDIFSQSYIHLIWNQLTTQIQSDRLERGGFKIITTLDYDLQIQSECAAEIHLARIQGKNTENETTNSTDCQAARLLPTLSFDNDIFSDGLTANLIVIDPRSGQVLSMVGSSSQELVSTPLTAHPSGSLLTPFVYLTAFTRGFSPASLMWDIPMDLPDIPIDSLTPTDEFQGPVRLREALANDYLVPAIQIINQIGTENIIQTARQLGLTSLAAQPSGLAGSCPSCGIILGDAKTTLMEAIQAYGVFTNQGLSVGWSPGENPANGLQSLQPITILNVSDLNGKIWMQEPTVVTRPVISPQLAYLITDILSDEAARWPSLSHPNPLEIGRPAGAKMGQTINSNDVWTVGYTPQLVVGVWIGSENPDSVSAGEASPKIAAALWHAVIQYATQNLTAADWQTPPGITTMDVCTPSGMLPTTQCPAVVSEVFLMGQEPTQPDNLYKASEINRETGRLATVFTPPELIVEQTYLNIPPEAREWAQRAGLHTPPTTFDIISKPNPSPNTQITFPEMFSHLNEEITIFGNVLGDDFESYRIQVGEGLNPSGWIVIQEDSFSPVEGGVLGTWDTSGLDGVYALQLVVIRDEQRVEIDTIQVTVDNTQPDIDIPYPLEGQIISYSSDKTITFQAQINDNLDLDFVDFFVDDQLIATLTQAPYAIPWRSSPGEHIFRVKATDLAGNVSEVQVSFIVER